MKRRAFLKTSLAFGAGCAIAPRRLFAASSRRKKVLMLGIDGMDVTLTNELLRQGVLPNVQKLIEVGALSSVMTSNPPQSPVAWSNIAVGGTTAIHGIYDFIHRDPATLAAYLSTSKVVPPARLLHLGKYEIPVSSGKIENLQQGKPFWEFLTERDIPTTLFRMPANFPCRGGAADMVSGMGTPDLRGGYGNFTLLTDAPQNFKPNFAGGRLVKLDFRENLAASYLPGPANTMQTGQPEVTAPVTIWRDRVNPVARIKFQDHELLLREGEWSGWMQITFPMLGALANVKGICKVYLKSVHPNFALYVTPINIDPSDPALPVVSSPAYGKLLTEQVGYFYTQGFPENTKALSEGIFTEDEYLEQARQVFEESGRFLDFELARFQKQDQGLLFFYYSSLDQNSHMYWRTIDPDHPQYTPELHQHYGETLQAYYCRVDALLAKVLDQYDLRDPEFTLMLMSDHGFCPFRRQVNLNTWLYQKGYLALGNASQMKPDGYFSDVNWKRTGAYNLGINAIYLNLQGREPNGIVLANQAARIKKSLRDDLLQLVDPATGARAVKDAWIVPDAERQRHPHAPDLIVGWDYGYRTSWESILGGFTPEIFADNLDKWSGDHCVDPSIVPSIFITNKRLTKPDPGVWDIAPTILQEFDIPAGDEMQGAPLYTA